MATATTATKRRGGNVNVRISQELKDSADAVIESLGLTPTDVIRCLYKQISLKRAIPFELTLPDETVESIEASHRGDGKSYNSFAEMMRDVEGEMQREDEADQAHEDL